MQRFKITNRTKDTPSFEFLMKHFRQSGRTHRHLGTGAFASVYSIRGNKNRVMKFTDEYDNYLKYIKWIAKSRGAYPFMPRVFRAYVCNANKRALYGRNARYNYNYNYSIDTYDEDGARKDVNAYAFEIERLYNARTREQKRLAEQVMDFVEEAENGFNPTTREWSLLSPSLADFCRKLVHMCEKYETGLDAYGRNILFRADGQLVISDPFC